MPDERILFMLPEYDVALKRFINTSLHALMREKDAVLKMIPTERRESVTTTQNTMLSGEVVRGEPLMTEMRFEINNSDVLEGHVDGFLASIDAAAEDGLKTLMPQIFGRI